MNKRASVGVVVGKSSPLHAMRVTLSSSAIVRVARMETSWSKRLRWCGDPAAPMPATPAIYRGPVESPLDSRELSATGRRMLRLCTFGGCRLERDGAEWDVMPGQRKGLALLALLAATGDRGLAREVVAAYLWPDSD